MPPLALAAKKYADKLEDDGELHLASACEGADAVRSGMPTNDPELKSERGTETPKVPVTELPFAS